MRKNIAKLLIFVIITALMPISSVSALSYNCSYLFYEDFETESFEYTTYNATASYETENTYGKSHGAVKVDLTGKYGEVGFPITFEQDTQYTISAKIKLVEAVDAPWQFILKYNDHSSIYYEFDPTVTATVGEWTTINCTYTHDGKGMCWDSEIQDGPGWAYVGPDAILSMRPYGGIDGFTYYLDELSVERNDIIDSTVSTENIILSTEADIYGDVIFKADAENEITGFYRILKGDTTNVSEMGCIRSGTVSGKSITYLVKDDDFGSYFALEIIPEKNGVRGEKRVIIYDKVIETIEVQSANSVENSLNGEFLENPHYITYNDFEVGTGQFKNSSTEFSRISTDTYGESNGALKVLHTGRAYVPVEFELGCTYKMSAKIKLLDSSGLTEPVCRFVLEYPERIDGSDEGAGAEYDTNIIATEEWQTMSLIYTFDGTSGGVVRDEEGNANYSIVEVTPKARFSLRIAGGNDRYYLIDDVYIEKISEPDAGISAENFKMSVVTENGNTHILKGTYESDYDVFYRILKSEDENFENAATVSSGCTQKGEFDYRITKEDLGKYFRAEIIPYLN